MKERYWCFKRAPKLDLILRFPWEPKLCTLQNRLRSALPSRTWLRNAKEHAIQAIILGLESCEIVSIINARNVDLTEMSAEHLKECSPSEWWKEIKRLGRVTNSSGVGNNVRKAVRHLEGVRDISPTDFANHVNWAFLNTTEGFFRSPTIPTIQNTLVCLR